MSLLVRYTIFPHNFRTLFSLLQSFFLSLSFQHPQYGYNESIYSFWVKWNWRRFIALYLLSWIWFCSKMVYFDDLSARVFAMRTGKRCTATANANHMGHFICKPQIICNSVRLCSGEKLICAVLFECINNQFESNQCACARRTNDIAPSRICRVYECMSMKRQMWSTAETVKQNDIIFRAVSCT